MGLLDAIAGSANSIAGRVGDAATSVSLQAQSAMLAQEIVSIKSQWGRESFEAFGKDDQKSVASAHAQAVAKIKELELKKQTIDASRASAGQIMVTIPQGVAPGGIFVVQMPTGVQVQVTCPPHMGPGQQLYIDMPQVAVAVAVGNSQGKVPA